MENNDTLKELLQEVRALHQSHKKYLCNHTFKFILFILAALAVAIGIFVGNFLWYVYLPIPR